MIENIALVRTQTPNQPMPTRSDTTLKPVGGLRVRRSVNQSRHTKAFIGKSLADSDPNGRSRSEVLIADQLSTRHEALLARRGRSLARLLGYPHKDLITFDQFDSALHLQGQRKLLVGELRRVAFD